MLYELTKAAHLFSLFVWIGGMIAVAVALRYPAPIDMKALQTYDRAVTTPAMIVALAAGIILGALGGWFTSIWLGVKILLVLSLSGLHGALVGRLRRAKWEGHSDHGSANRLFFPVGFVLLLFIVLLVTIKPW